jgi:hypothetical protein
VGKLAEACFSPSGHRLAQRNAFSVNTTISVKTKMPGVGNPFVSVTHFPLNQIDSAQNSAENRVELLESLHPHVSLGRYFPGSM